MSCNFILSCESTVDLDYEYVSGRGISVLFYKLSIDGKQIEDNMDRDSEFNNNFFDILNGTSSINTSQINQFIYEEYFNSLVEKSDQPILHLAFGTGMTSSYFNAVNAAKVINEKLSDERIFVVDTLCSCGGYGMITDDAADLRDNGDSVSDVYKWCEENKLCYQHHFFNSDLSYFIKSGRVSGLAGNIANVLNIVPIMCLNSEGRMVAYSKVRGVKKSMSKLLDQMIEHAKDGLNYNGKCFINHSYNLEEANMLAAMIKEKFKKIPDVKIYNIGNVIASHCGPKTISLFFFGDARVN